MPFDEHPYKLQCGSSWYKQVVINSPFIRDPSATLKFCSTDLQIHMDS